jgi:hypothetical protein
MPEQMSTQDLKDRLILIESMIAAGRRTTESWGWTFLLWGVAYYVAIGWTTWTHNPWAWPVTMMASVVLTVILSSLKAGREPDTTMGRAVGAVWIALGCSIFLVFLALGISGRLSDLHVFVAVASGMLGMANATSGLILRWRVQFACALVWWTASVAACFGTENQTLIVFLIAIFFCQIVFGIYGMIAKARERRLHGAAHA